MKNKSKKWKIRVNKKKIRVKMTNKSKIKNKSKKWKIREKMKNKSKKWKIRVKNEK